MARKNTIKAGNDIIDIETLIGKKFSFLTVMYIVGRRKYKTLSHPIISVKCDCGVVKEVTVQSVISGKTKSCGCYNTYRVANLTKSHGLRYHRLYNVWVGIKSRCCNPKSPIYKYYGGRGISVDKEWINDAAAFIKWSEENGWEHGLDLDRIDNNGNYSTSNCRFVSAKVNMRNKGNNNVQEYKGEAKSLSHFTDVLNLPYATVYARLRKGWTIEAALEKPVRHFKNYKNENNINTSIPNANDGAGKI